MARDDDEAQRAQQVEHSLDRAHRDAAEIGCKRQLRRTTWSGLFVHVLEGDEVRQLERNGLTCGAAARRMKRRGCC